MLDVLKSAATEASLLSILEIIAVLTAIIYVILAAKGNKWCFWFGLISSAIYVYITFNLNFYFDVAINVYYVIMSFYGWFSWSHSENETALKISTLGKGSIIRIIGVGIIVTLLLALGADRFSNASLPYLDALTTVFAIIATYLVVQKKLENWLIWVVVDLVAAGMYFYKELYFTALLFLIYTIIAIVGYNKWKREVL